MGFTIDEELELLRLYEAEDFDRQSKWLKGDLSWKLHSAQKKIYDTLRSLPKHVRDAILYCARRWGKSYLVCCLAIEDCLQHPGEIIRIVGPEIEQTLEIVEFNINKIIADAPEGLIAARTSKRRWRIGKSVLAIGAFDKKNVRKNLGKEAYAIYTEEAGASKSDEFAYGMREVISPQLFRTKGRITHATTPPPELDHVFETEYVPKASLNGTLFRFTIHDNPMADVEMHRQAIEDSGGIHTAAYKRNYLVQACKDAGIVVIPTFDQPKHVKEFEIPTHATWLIMGDWGGVKDRTWCGVGFWDYARAKLCIVAEIDYDPNTESGRIASDIRHLESYQHPIKTVLKHNEELFWPRWVDCHGQTQVDLSKDHDLDVAIPVKDHFDAAINQLVLGFLNDQIEIHPRCTKLIATCEYGRFTKNRKDFQRTPTLGHCDAVAGLMYGWRMVDRITNPFPKPILNREDWWEPEVEESEKSLREFASQVKVF